jgi:hypothetical protein
MNFLKISPLIIAIGAGLGCSEDTSKGAANTVPTSLVITASSQSSTIAANKLKPSFLNLFIPQAYALPSPAMVDQSGANLVLSEAWIVLKDIEFKLTETADSGGEAAEGDEMSIRGPFVVDLLSANPAPVESKNIAAASIKRIKFKLHEMQDLPAGSPAELAGNSIFIRGTVGGVAFTYSSRDGAEISVGGPTGVVPDANSDLLMAFQVANLFKSINMSSITTPTDISDSNRVAGSNLCPSIDSSAGDIYTCLRKGLEKEAKFGKDSDKSHEIEDTEDEVEDPAE